MLTAEATAKQAQPIHFKSYILFACRKIGCTQCYTCLYYYLASTSYIWSNNKAQYSAETEMHPEWYKLLLLHKML